MEQLKANYFWFCHEAFLSVSKQVHIKFEGDDHLYRVFGEGDTRYVRRVETATKQPKVTSKKLTARILAEVDRVEPLKINGTL